jgi:hypothetical protein
MLAVEGVPGTGGAVVMVMVGDQVLILLLDPV